MNEAQPSVGMGGATRRAPERPMPLGAAGKTRREQRAAIRHGLKVARRLDGIAAGQVVMKAAIAAHPRHLYDQLTYFFNHFEIPAINGRERKVSTATTIFYEGESHRILKTLAMLRVPLRDMTDLTFRHTCLVIRQMEADGSAASVLQNSWTVLQRLLDWCGKPSRSGSHRRLAEVLADPGRAARQNVITDPGTFESKGLDVHEVLDRVRERSVITHAQMLLQHAFGLRAKESRCFDPFAADQGNHIRVDLGTKGGRPRSVPLETRYQRFVLDEVKKVAQYLPKTLLGYPGLTLLQAKNRYQNILRRCGLTKKDLGVTSHSLRRQFAQDYYERCVGRQAPVVAGVLDLPRKQDPASREQEMQARLKVAQALGHGRVEVTGAYCGTVGTMRRFQLANINRWTQDLEGDDALRQAMHDHNRHAAELGGVLSLHLAGEAAKGIPPRLSAVFYFVLTNEPLHAQARALLVDGGQPAAQADPGGPGEPANPADSAAATARMRGVKAMAASDLEPHLTRLMGMTCRIVEQKDLAEWTGGVDDMLEVDLTTHRAGGVAASDLH